MSICICQPPPYDRAVGLAATPFACISVRHASACSLPGGTMPRMRFILPTHRALSLCAGVALAASCMHGRRDTGPATSPIVTADDIERSAGTPIEQILESKVPGIQVTRVTGGGISIRIRGTSSFYGNNEPLYVIDGTPMEAGPRGALNGVNPYDIESIRVLKDPAETGVYGVRGANGVIVVTTKRPGGHDKPRRPEDGAPPTPASRCHSHWGSPQRGGTGPCDRAAGRHARTGGSA